MTLRKKIVPQMRLSDEVPGFRIGPDGELEVMTEAETQAVVKRAIYEAMVRAGFRIRPSAPTLH